MTFLVKDIIKCQRLPGNKYEVLAVDENLMLVKNIDTGFRRVFRCEEGIILISCGRNKNDILKRG